MRKLEHKMYHPGPNETRNQSTNSVIASFLKKKRSETVNETISFQEMINYLKQNKLNVYPEIEQKNKSDEELLTELLTSKIDISEQNKSFIKKEYRWKQILILGTYPQLDKVSHSMLGLAATFADTNYIKQLINEGADVNLAMSYGMTPLMVAACNESHFSMYNACIKVLLEAEADCNMEASFSGIAQTKETALDFAVMRGNEGAVKLLLQYGASITNKTIEKAEEKLRNTLFPHPHGPEKNILTLLTQAKQGIIKTREPLMTEIVEKALSPKLIKDLAGIVASYDTRSYDLRYFKVTKDKHLEPLFSEERSFVNPVTKIFKL